jgi:hypothetical protein
MARRGATLASERQASRIYPSVVADGSGGVYVSWAEQAINGDMSVWLLRLRSDGRPARGWPEDGVVLSAPSAMTFYLFRAGAIAEGSRGRLDGSAQ